MENMVLSLMVMGIVSASFLFIGWIVWIGLRRQRERQQSEIDLRARMLEKFGSSEEFVAFMSTEAGHQFLDTRGDKAKKSLRRKVASSLASGVVLVALGGAFFLLFWQRDIEGLLFPAAILTALGIGLAISAFIYRTFSGEEKETT